MAQWRSRGAAPSAGPTMAPHLLCQSRARHRHPGRLRVPDRAALAGILFVLRTGVAWRASQGYVSRAEAGRLAVRGERLALFAAALRYTPEMLCRATDNGGVGVGLVHHRKRASMGALALRRVHATLAVTRLQVEALTAASRDDEKNATHGPASTWRAAPPSRRCATRPVISRARSACVQPWRSRTTSRAPAASSTSTTLETGPCGSRTYLKIFHA